MNRSNTNKKYPSNDPSWLLLAEFSLSDFMFDQDKKDELRAGLPFQTMRELGLSVDFIDSIEMTLRSFAKEALARFKQGGLELPERIQVFCQKKLIEDARVARTSRSFIQEHNIENESKVRSETYMKGGWGYFLIEGRGNFPNSCASNSCNSIDLYLYKEGQ
jgi:hypothetical protein